jgi:hypothetical protein
MLVKIALLTLLLKLQAKQDALETQKNDTPTTIYDDTLTRILVKGSIRCRDCPGGWRCRHR